MLFMPTHRLAPVADKPVMTVPALQLVRLALLILALVAVMLLYWLLKYVQLMSTLPVVVIVPPCSPLVLNAMLVTLPLPVPLLTPAQRLAPVADNPVRNVPAEQLVRLALLILALINPWYVVFWADCDV